MGALTGIRVIELSQVLAAPFCGYQFALLGADVIKVELPDTPDCARGRGPLPALNAKGIGLTYQVQGGNKKSLALNIRTEPGRAALLKLVENADVFLENYSTGALDTLGLGYAALRQCNPRIVYCSITGYGDQGPKASKGAYDNTIQAASGAIGQSGGHKPGVSFVDYAAGYSAAFAIAAALLQRERTGRGCHISTSMLEVALSLMAPEAAAQHIAPEVPKRKEAGISAFDTADGTLMLGAFKPSQYRKLGACLAAQGHDVPVLDRISEWTDIWQNSDTIRVALQDIFILRSADAWQSVLEAADIPAERIVTLAESIAAPQLAARGYFAPSPADPSIALPLAGFRMTEGGAELQRAPPVLGRDSREVLTKGGLSATEIDALFAAGVAK
ncbi:CaiB/BaiF CoA transferase family protein [Roseinatronobacter alkalisoli]|uniref:CaiB/BaiF CoA-transferase family protein n=1 Tax=Roseinatronobacter alkalisoli TaxID=3028235 RepID=A0ABT5TBV4_9RHOB|nr:CaiB/BaiF CoA-transferase family protein [Roseinatronobacter sp. HJB301]MDD7972170.1 CaiB/BaiF CoA-transferase family protein [Roseinatronobacter sp. HJB301]